MRYQPITPVYGDHSRFWDNNVKGTWRCSVCRAATIISLFIGIQFSVAVYAFYYCYEHVYPGSKIAAVIDVKYNVFHLFYWTFVVFASIFNFVICSWVYRCTTGPIKRWFPCYPFVATVIFCVVGSWPLWVAALVELIWQNVVWNNACQGWDITAVLQGVGSSYSRFHIQCWISNNYSRKWRKLYYATCPSTFQEFVRRL